MVTLQTSSAPPGLSLAVDSVKEQHIGELAIELGYACEWTVENALRLQQRGRGEAPEGSSGGDPWGNSPL